MKKVFIIAEAGVNHNGSVEIAKDMVDIALGAGADAVKFQSFKAERIVTATAPKAPYQIKNTGTAESQFEMLKKLELSPSENRELFAYCRRRDILFMSTPFDEKSADMLDSLDMKIFKIPSGEITNKRLLRHIAKKQKPIILSTGMSYLEEVAKAVGWIKKAWGGLGKRRRLTLLHCVSSYPAPVGDVNLKAMRTLAEAFDLPVGYSDHTLGIEIPIAAVAMGASVVEKHFTLDKSMKGPDHKASLDPDELKRMVTALRNIEKAIGDGIKKSARCEENARHIIRRSLVAARDIKAGNIVGRRDIAIKRPGTGLPPELMERVINKTLRVDVKKDSLLQKHYFSGI